MASKLEKKFIDLWIVRFPDLYLHQEVTLIPKRKYRFDFVHMPSKICVEINGGIWNNGRHSRGSGLVKEYEKYNLAQLQGYKVFVLASNMINSKWLDKIAEAIWRGNH